MALDFAEWREIFSVYAQESSTGRHAIKPTAFREESYEKRARAVFEVSGGGGGAFIERQDI